MVTAAEQAEFLEEIRRQVCSRCVERPPGGPPCAPLGKVCGIELHLPALIDAIHEVQSPLIETYLECNRRQICSQCSYLHSSICPCPMDYLLVLIVQAVETVDQRHERRQQAHQLVASLPRREGEGLAEICRAYEEAAGTWTGCDWSTRIGDAGLDLNGWTAEEAADMAVETSWIPEGESWEAAARWLTLVEQHAVQAEVEASWAVAAASAGKWQEATEHADRAWALEFATGRPLWRGFPLTWQRLRQAVTAAAMAPGHPPRNEDGAPKPEGK